MSFQSGRMTFRRMHIAGTVCEDVAEQLARRTLDLSSLKTARGWASWSSAIQPARDADAVTCAGYTRAQFVRCKPAIQARYRREAIRDAWDREAKRRGQTVRTLDRRTKADLRKEVDDSLFASSTPAVGALELAYMTGESWLFCNAMTERERDLIAEEFRHASGGLLYATTFSTWCAANNIQLREVPAWDFPDGREADTGTMQDDFLTWLWALSVEGESVPGVEAVIIDGPVTLYGEGAQGPRTVQLRSGTPTLGAELLTALREGKKITSALLTLAVNSQVFEGGIDHSLAFRSVKFPDTESDDAPGVFLERMQFATQWTDAVYGLVAAFVRERMDAKAWRDRSRTIADRIGGRKQYVKGESSAQTLERQRGSGKGGGLKADITLTVDMDKNCSKCRKPGACENGLCLMCNVGRKLGKT